MLLVTRQEAVELGVQFGKALLLFCGTLGDAVVHLLHVDVLDTETGWQAG